MRPDIPNLIAEDKSERAIVSLLSLLEEEKITDKTIFNRIIIISGRLTSLNQKSQSGLISHSEAQLEKK